MESSPKISSKIWGMKAQAGEGANRPDRYALEEALADERQ